MWYNPIMIWLLNSPLHWILSGITVVYNFTGRNSGKKYRVPAGYFRMGSTLLTTSFKPRKWWRNLRGGAEVILRLEGKDVSGHAEVIEDEQGVVQGIKSFISGNPLTARMFGLKIDPNGQIEETNLRAAASDRVFVRTTLL